MASRATGRAGARSCCRGGTYDEHVCFALAQEPVGQPVHRPAHRWLTRQSDRLVDAVKVSAVMIDMIPVDNRVTTGLTGAMNSVNYNMPPLVQQMTSEDDLSADPEYYLHIGVLVCRLYNPYQGQLHQIQGK